MVLHTQAGSRRLVLDVHEGRVLHFLVQKVHCTRHAGVRGKVVRYVQRGGGLSFLSGKGVVAGNMLSSAVHLAAQKCHA